MKGRYKDHRRSKTLFHWPEQDYREESELDVSNARLRFLFDNMKSGVAVYRAINKGEDFIAYVASHDVPLVVLDIWMEEMTGLEVLARLCAISPQTRVIVITAREDSAARITAMQIGIVAFFIKPFNDEKFLAAVRDALNLAAAALAHTVASANPR